MSKTLLSKRRYHSPLRVAQADATRRRIVDAGLELFARQGVQATSISELARAAGVAPETVYGTFGSKQGVLEAVAASVLGERFPFERWEGGLAARAGDAPAQIALTVEVMGDFYAANPDVVALFEHGEASGAFDAWRDARYGPPDQVYRDLPPGTLRDDIDPMAAARLVNTLLAPELYARLCGAGGWPLADYKRRMTDLLEHALLAERPRG